MDSLVEPEEDFTKPPWGALGRDFTLGFVALGSKFVLRVLNSLVVARHEEFRQQVMHREPGRALITVCNHTSTLDDPMIFSAMLPWSFFWTESQHHKNRWSLCAREICYKSFIFRQIFQNGKTLPIDRGAGVSQPIMQVAADRAAEGDWVHIFPEARIGYSGRLQAVKWGVGRLVCDSIRDDKEPPILLPFYHSGMGHILPKGCIIPRPGNAVHVTVGSPVDISDLAPRCNCAELEQTQVWTAIANRVSEALTQLERESPPNWDQLADNESKKQSAAPPVEPDMQN